MSYVNLLSRAFASLVLGSLALMALPAHAQSSSSRFVTIEPAQPSDTQGKTEVLEFFSYGCNHCAAIEPLIGQWKPKLPDNVVLRPVPVAFNASMVELQKLYYALEAMNRLDLHAKVFTTIHNEKKSPFSDQWLKENDIDPAQFKAVMGSFGMQAKIDRANELSRLYKIDGTPSFGVAGKYLTSPSMTGDYQSALDEVSRLLATTK